MPSDEREPVSFIYRNTSLCPHLEGEMQPADGHRYCPAEVDRAGLCWNFTRAGTVTSQPCPSIIYFDTNEKASRECLKSGEWFQSPQLPNETWTNFQRCLRKDTVDVYIYYAGYSISVVALLISLFIFFKFRQLQCYRVTIHKHLFVAYLLNAVIWICYYSLLQDTKSLQENGITCQAIHLVANYLSCATYLWMFCEGFYLLIILKLAFVRLDRKLLYICMEIGWGLPLVLTTIYGGVRGAIARPKKCWIKSDLFSYIIQVPVIVSLALNFIFVAIIFHLLLTKLRNATSPDLQQGRKAAKAILILVPLLGLQYIVTLISPTKESPMEKPHRYVVAVLVSFQGLLVAVLFCFCNQEVQDAWLANTRRLAYTLGFPLGRSSQTEISGTRTRQQPTSNTTPTPDSIIGVEPTPLLRRNESPSLS